MDAPALSSPQPLRPPNAVLHSLADASSFCEWDSGLRVADPIGFRDPRSYADRLRVTRLRTGSSEALISGSGRIGGRPVALAAFVFDFLGGGLGCVAGEKLARLFERAAERGWPAVVVHCSGGARVQEGTFALAQLAKICAAVARYRASGAGPYVSVLRDPTMGGALASSGALGDVLVAERGARIGFAGPRVVRETLGTELPDDLQRAERLYERGLIDLVVEPGDLRPLLARLIRMTARSGRRAPRPVPDVPLRAPAAPRGPVGDRMEIVRRSRRLDRPRFDAWVKAVASSFVELRGDRAGSDDCALRGGLARVAQRPVILLGTDRGAEVQALRARNFGMPGPAGYRKARRLFELADRLRLPVVTLVDTPGADPLPESERGGQGFAIAEAIRTLVTLDVPTIGVLFGEGGSGGALALTAVDHLIALECTHLSVLSPEGCAAILWRHRSEAARAAEQLRSSARDLHRDGIIDEVIAEPQPLGGGIPPGLAGDVRAAVASALVRLERLTKEELAAHRSRRLRSDARLLVEAPNPPEGIHSANP